METTYIDSALKTRRIRPTHIRRSIYEILQKKNFALSQAEIAGELQTSFNRVTIYRTLNKFLKNGLIHKVVDEFNTKYALCNKANCDIKMHHDEHVHFKCEKCGHIFCLDSTTISTPELPTGFQINFYSLTAGGICRDCVTEK